LLEESKEVVSIEHNLTGQLSKLIRQELGIEIENKLLKHSGEPFSVKEILNYIKNL